MEFEVRPVRPDEVEAFTRADLTAFGQRFDPARFEHEWTHIELDRTLAAFDDDQIVGTGRLYSLEMTLPGGRLLPIAGVSWIAVLPTHRRRGILTAIMRRHLDDAAARHEPVVVLLASEGLIYRRFGYGMATSSMAFTLERRHSAFLHPVADAGRVRLVDDGEARKLLPDVFDRVRRTQPGAISRPEAWWPSDFFYVDPKEEGTDYVVVHESPDGDVDGYAAYRIITRWDDVVSRSRLEVHEVVTAAPEVRAALWRYLCDVDLTDTVVATGCPVDEPLRWLLAESRRLHVNRLSEWLWVRIVDLPVALSARAYDAPGRLVLEIRDGFRPDGAAAGRFALETGADGAAARPTDEPADLALDVADLGAAYLGGVSFSTLARAGLVEEQAAGALTRADAMFRTDPAPHAMTWF